MAQFVVIILNSVSHGLQDTLFLIMVFLFVCLFSFFNKLYCLPAFAIKSMIWMHCCAKYILLFQDKLCKFSIGFSCSSFSFSFFLFIYSFLLWLTEYVQYKYVKSDRQQKKRKGEKIGEDIIKGQDTRRKAQWVATCCTCKNNGLLIQILYLAK